MNRLLAIIKKLDGSLQNSESIYYNMDQDNQPWTEKKPEDIINVFKSNKSVFNSIQKKPFTHLIISGESILNKQFDFNNEITVKSFQENFPNFKPDSIIVSASILQGNLGQALFLPKFKLDAILDLLNTNEITVSEISLCNSSQNVDQIIFRNIPHQINENNLKLQWFTGFKNTVVKGAILLLSIFSILFGIEKYQEYLLNGQLNVNSVTQLHKIQLQEINTQIAAYEQIIFANSKGAEPYKYPFLNEIAVTCPNQIRLSMVKYAPVLGKIQPEQKVQFQEKSIQIQGTTSTLPSLHNWINILKSQNWVENIEIIEIEKNTDQNKLVFSFNIFHE